MPIPSTSENRITKAALAAFFVALAADLLFVIMEESQPRYFSKPLIVAALMVFVLASRNSKRDRLLTLLLAALFFSWGGDILLMLEPMDPQFFLYGLSSFLLAHIFYIVLFSIIGRRESIKIQWRWVVLAAIYYGVLLFLLFPRLGNMQVPVVVYGLVICSMLVIALHLFPIKNTRAAYAIAAGAVLFVLSDSLLAFNKFHTSFAGAGFIVMLTYGLAQYFLATGICHYAKAQVSAEPVI